MVIAFNMYDPDRLAHALRVGHKAPVHFGQLLQ